MPIHVILDTDVGEDPDEVFALMLALASREIAVDLIVTSDEQSGKRAAFAEAILKALSKDVPVIRGHESVKEHALFVVGELVDKLVDQGYVSIPTTEDYVKRIKGVVEANEETTYLCISPFTNLAEFIRREPLLSSKLDVVVMGGALNYRNPAEAEHNVRYSISDRKSTDGKPEANAALEVFKSPVRMRWVLSDTTFKPDAIGVRKGDQIYKMLESSHSAASELLLSNCDSFFASKHPVTIMHDPLAVACVIDKSLVSFEEKDVVMLEDGRMREAGPREAGDNTRRLSVSTGARYAEFMSLMAARLEGMLCSATNADKFSELKRIAPTRKLKS